MSKLDDLIAEYNQAEAGQQERLKQIFDIVDARVGYRRVQFGNGNNPSVQVWSNCWNRRKDLAYKTFVDPLARLITACEPGED